LEPFIAGTVTSSSSSLADPGFVIRDLSHDLETPFATVDVPYANGEFNVVLFMEPIEESSYVQTAIALGATIEDYTRGGPNALRPRVAAIIRQDFMSLLVPDSPEVDWEVQTKVWNESPISSNLAGSNAGQANYTNGVYWGLACRDAQRMESEAWYYYSTRSFGYFIEGALAGHELCTGYMVDQIELSKDDGILDFDVLSDALNPRGRVVDDAIVQRINEIWSSYEEPEE
jgi:hypothetical protein